MATTDPTKWERTRLKIKNLTQHPLQGQFYGHTTTPAEDAAFREELKRNGQRDAVHVMPGENKAGLPGGTVLDGWRRVQTLLALGQDDVDAVIRHDLADASASDVELTFLGFNLGRRQLHPLDKARVVLGMFEIEKRRPRGRLRPSELSEARDRVGQAISMSGRNLQRYVRLLLTPVEVQRAVRDGVLPLVLGEQVEGLSDRTQRQIAERISGGETPKSVVLGYLSSGGYRSNADEAFVRLLRNLRQAREQLDGRFGEIKHCSVKSHVPQLQQAIGFIHRLISQANG